MIMPDDSEIEFYSYSLPERLAYLLVSLFLGFLALSLSIFAICFLPLSLIKFIAEHDLRSVLAGLAIWLGPVFLAHVSLLFFNSYPQIGLSNEGIYVTVFFVRQVFIPWSEVDKIQKITLPQSRSRLIVVRRLTPFHKLVGWQWGGIFKPAFVVRATLPGRDRVIRAIRERVENKSDSV